jgi:hypothetical protein
MYSPSAAPLWVETSGQNKNARFVKRAINRLPHGVNLLFTVSLICSTANVPLICKSANKSTRKLQKLDKNVHKTTENDRNMDKKGDKKGDKKSNFIV